MGGHESQISPIPPERYGDRFVRFISGVTMSRERAEKARLSATLRDGGITVPSGIEGTLHDPVLGGMNVPAITRDHVNPPGTERVMQKAEHMAEKSRRKGSNEEESIPDRSLMAVSSPGDLTLPVIGEAGENSSNFSRTPSHHHATPRQSREQIWNPAASSSSIPPLPMIGNADMPSDAIGEVPPPTPPKMDGSVDTRRATERQSWGGRPPPTPPKDLQQRPPVFGKDKELPLPPSRTQFSASPMHMSAASSSEEDTFGLGGGGGGGGPRQ
jgi:1-phosphatidylinositol-4-phosphate 5-kinase